MKKTHLFTLFSLFLSFSTFSWTGQLHVKPLEGLNLFHTGIKGKTQSRHIPFGWYNYAEVSLLSSNKLRIKLPLQNKIKIKLPSQFHLPSNGDFFLTAADSGQQYAMGGNTSTSTNESELQWSTESCSYFTVSRRCLRQCRSEKKYERRREEERRERRRRDRDDRRDRRDRDGDWQDDRDNDRRDRRERRERRRRRRGRDWSGLQPHFAGINAGSGHHCQSKCTVLRWGTRDVSFRNRWITKELDLEFLNSSNEVMATFSGSQTESWVNYEYTSTCRHY